MKRAALLVAAAAWLFGQTSGTQSNWVRPQAYRIASPPLLPTPGVTNRLVFVVDCESTSACSVGGGTTRWLFRDTGSAWERAHPVGGGGGGSGCIVSGSDNQIVTDDGGGGCVSEAQWMIAANVLTAGASGAADFGSASYFKIPTSAGSAPTANGRVSYDSTANKYKFGANGATKTIATEDGNIATATALAANPSDCSANNFANTIAANGDLTCGQPSITAGVSGLGTGVATALATPSSANLAAAITDETGSGAAVFATSPTLVTPALGTPSAVVLTNATGTASGLTAGAATALAANGANCSGNIPRGVDASGAAEGCADVDLTTEVTGLLPRANIALQTVRMPLVNAFSMPDSSGNVWFEPFTIKAAVGSDKWGHQVIVYGNSSTDDILHGRIDVPQDFVSGAKACVVWTSTVNTGDVVFGFAYRSTAVTGGLDNTAVEETLTFSASAAPATDMDGIAPTCVSLTDANLAAGDILQFRAARNGTSGSDTLSGEAIVLGWWLEYQGR